LAGFAPPANRPFGHKPIDEQSQEKIVLAMRTYWVEKNIKKAAGRKFVRLE
jgi:hypothetical protein